MAAGTLLSQAAVKYQLTPVLGRALLRALLWCVTKGISLKCCCSSRACVWALVVGRDCSTSTKCCCYFCVCLSWQMHFGVERKSSCLSVKPLFLPCPHLGYPPPMLCEPLHVPLGCVTIMFWENTEKKNAYLIYKTPYVQLRLQYWSFRWHLNVAQRAGAWLCLLVWW